MIRRTDSHNRMGDVKLAAQMAVSRVALAIAFTALLFPVTGCSPTKASSDHKPTAPAKVEKLSQETEIARITLTEKAEQRLGVTLAKVTREVVQQRRTFGGELMIPAGKSIMVSAPLAGTITTPKTGVIPLPGQTLKAAAPVMSLAPLLSPERYVPTPAERVQMANARATLMSALTIANGDVQRSETELAAANITLNRAAKLLEDRAGSAKSVDDARALRDVSETSLKAASERETQFKKLLTDLDKSGASGTAAPLLMTSPQAGVMRNVSVTRGQTVSTGAPLFEVVDVTSLWIRVPIYVGLLTEIELTAEAIVVGLDGRASLTPRKATPVAAPPTADPLSTTVDLYFTVDNANGRLRPGQRIGVDLSLKGQQEGFVVPAKSILYDIYGGTWVYIKSGDHAFERRRVLIRYTVDERVVLAKSPPVATQVVVDGAAELYGTEFGVGK
jgi:membrane fusion protein, heavy metal efflux system